MRLRTLDFSSLSKLEVIDKRIIYQLQFRFCVCVVWGNSHSIYKMNAPPKSVRRDKKWSPDVVESVLGIPYHHEAITSAYTPGPQRSGLADAPHTDVHLATYIQFVLF